MNLFNESDSEVEPLGPDLIAPAPQLTPRITTTTFSGLLSSPLQIYEDLSRGCGGQIWPAGELLTRYILRRYGGGTRLRGKRIVELGAGGGLTGLAVAAGCDLGEGAEMWITDMAAMMDMMRQNVELNGLQDRVKVELLDWADPIPESIALRDVDIVLAADCVYYEPAFPLLEKTLLSLVGEKTVVFFCFKKRRRADLTFMKKIKKRLNVQEVQDDPEYREHDEGYAEYSRDNLFLYVMTKKV